MHPIVWVLIAFAGGVAGGFAAGKALSARQQTGGWPRTSGVYAGLVRR